MRRSHPSPHHPVRKREELPERDTKVFLQPGELWIDDVPALVKTILGSCLAITVRAPRLGLASMTHCLLPCAGSERGRLPRKEALKYVDTTMRILFDTFASRSAALSELEVKLIGGADSISPTGSANHYSVGDRNVKMALDGLEERGITPAASIVGGRAGRVMVFDSATGDVFVRRLLVSPRTFWEES
jgi:chemotaxis protein CheD